MIDFNLLKESLLKIPGLVEGFESMEQEIHDALVRYEPTPQASVPVESKVHTLHDVASPSPRSSPSISRSAQAAEHRAAESVSHRRSVSFASSPSHEAAMDEKTLALTFYAMGFKARIEQQRARESVSQIAREPTHMTLQMARDGEEKTAGCCCFFS